MKKSRFTETQIVAVLKEHEAGVATKDLCRRHGVSPAWRCPIRYAAGQCDFQGLGRYWRCKPPQLSTCPRITQGYTSGPFGKSPSGSGVRKRPISARADRRHAERGEPRRENVLPPQISCETRCYEVLRQDVGRANVAVLSLGAWPARSARCGAF